MRLTRDDKNKVFEAVARSSIDPAECNVQATHFGGVLNHESGSTFEFGYNEEQDEFWAVATVVDGFRRQIEDSPSFEYLLEAIPQWADEINQVARTPDLWAELQRSRELIAAIQRTGSENTPFTEDEQRQITSNLQAIKEQLRKQFELTAEQFERINARFDEAEEASKRIGRKDWLLLFGGTILNLIVTDTITPPVAGYVYMMVVQGIAHLFGGPPPQILT
jgi:hypothetical protein